MTCPIWRAHRELLDSEAPVEIDARGLKCPGPIVKAADAMRGLSQGQKARVEATEDAFASDIAVWCERTGNKLQKLEVRPEVIEVIVQKEELIDGVELGGASTFLGAGEKSDMSLFI